MADFVPDSQPDFDDPFWGGMHFGNDLEASPVYKNPQKIHPPPPPHTVIQSYIPIPIPYRSYPVVLYWHEDTGYCLLMQDTIRATKKYENEGSLV